MKDELLAHNVNASVIVEKMDSSNNNEQHWSAEPSAQARCVQFCCCPSKSDHVFQKLSYLLCVSLFRHCNSSSDSKAFLHFTVFSGSPTAVHRAFDVKAWPQSQTDFLIHIHYGITLWAYLFQTHRPNLALWVYLSKPLVKEVTNV